MIEELEDRIEYLEKLVAQLLDAVNPMPDGTRVKGRYQSRIGVVSNHTNDHSPLLIRVEWEGSYSSYEKREDLVTLEKSSTNPENQV